MPMFRDDWPLLVATQYYPRVQKIKALNAGVTKLVTGCRSSGFLVGLFEAPI
jgi:hypothetical protein